jgi:hypothetical protein
VEGQAIRVVGQVSEDLLISTGQIAARFGHPPGEFAVERAESELLLLAHVT